MQTNTTLSVRMVGPQPHGERVPPVSSGNTGRYGHGLCKAAGKVAPGCGLRTHHARDLNELETAQHRVDLLIHFLGVHHCEVGHSVHVDGVVVQGVRRFAQVDLVKPELKRDLPLQFIVSAQWGKDGRGRGGSRQVRKGERQAVCQDAGKLIKRNGVGNSAGSVTR